MLNGVTYFEHGYYGCWTGCCGVDIVTEFIDGQVRRKFEFDHSVEDARRHAMAITAKHGTVFDESRSSIDGSGCDNCWDN